MEIKSGFLPVSIDHQIYFEDIGNPAMNALFFVHGGPGIGCEEKHRHHFDLEKHRVILFDQRGCGKSESLGELNDNNTSALVSDIENIRKRLKLEKISLIGSSWGAVPVTLYAAQYPDQVSTLVLKSPFLARKKDFDWSYTSEGAAKLLSNDWKVFSQGFQGKELVAKFHKEIIENSQPDKESICRWLNWEGAQYFYTRPAERNDFTPDTLTPYWENVARIQIHFTFNNYFLDENGIIPPLEKISQTNIVGICLQGEEDIVTPATEVEELKRIWPSLEVRLITGADHKIPESELLKL